MKDLSRSRYSQNGQTSLPSDLTDSLYPPNSSMGASHTDIEKRQRARVNYSPQTLMRSSNVVVGPEVLMVSAASIARNYLLLQNNGGVDIFVAFGSTPNLDGGNSIVLAAGTALDFSNGIVPNNDVYAICNGIAALSILEGVKVG